jgi:4-hydroxy-tetrahydrodipicolinate synthase
MIAADIHGSMTALVTPFRGGQVDYAAIERLVDRQIQEGTDWLVPLGTTGETPALTTDEREKVLGAVVSRNNGRCPVMVGTGTNCTVTTIEQTKSAARASADAVLVVTPYYNRPPQEGLYRHFAAVADAVDLPLVLYNVPARTGVCMSNDTIVRLRERHLNIVAVKDATGNVDGVTDLVTRCDIAVLAGDDNLAWPMMALGAVGVVSVLGNLQPALMKALVSAAMQHDVAEATFYHRKVHDLTTEIGRFGPNPIPIKTAMAIAGLIEEEFRLPLCPLDGEARAALRHVLRRYENLEACSA